jgi:hypothetical protein
VRIRQALSRPDEPDTFPNNAGRLDSGLACHQHSSDAACQPFGINFLNGCRGCATACQWRMRSRYR